MIVICTKCQAKFRVADERVGPRGAKVRCSRCQTVFLVQRDAGAAEASTPVPPAPAAAVPPDDPFAPAAPAAAPDALSGEDPFGAPAPAPPSALVTDLSDLLGPPPSAPAPAPKPRAVPPPLPFARTAAAAPAPDPSPLPALDDSEPFDGRAPADDPNPFAPPVRADPFAPATPPAAPAAPVDDGGLALEDRFTPPPVKIAPAPEPPLEIAETSALEIAGGPPGPGAGPSAFGSTFAKASALASGGYDPNVADAFAPGSGDPFDPGPLQHGPGAAEPPAAGGDAASAAPALADAAPYAFPARAETARAAGDPPLPAAAVARAKRIAGQRSRVRAIAMNAGALVVLLLVALAMLALWRADGTLAPGAAPSALLAALRGGGRAAGAYEAREVRSGLYERLRGAPLLFVRGKVVSRASEAVPAVVVSVEVVREGAVLARGEAVAGGVATPEELHGAIDADALARAARAARSRAPREVRPGDELPFLVTVGDVPADLDGAALRVEVAPAGGGSQ